MHGARHLFQIEEQPSFGIRAWGKAFVSKRRTAEFWNTCMGQGIYFKENSRVLEYMHGARHLFQREEQPSVEIRALGKAFVSKRKTAECCNTCMGQGICFKEKNSRVLEYVHGARQLFQRENCRVLEYVDEARHLFQREEEPSVGIHEWGKAFISKRRTAECWNTCMGQGICFKEKNS